MIDDLNPEWAGLAVAGWNFGMAGDYVRARECFQKADDMNTYGRLEPDLAVLRFTTGDAVGMVSPVAPTEKIVIGFSLEHTSEEAADAYGMAPPTINSTKLAANIMAFKERFDPGYHKENISQTLPHVMVMSTGRCGTISLYHLFERTQLVPYHTYFFSPAASTVFEMMCQFMAGNFDSREPAETYLKTHAAEWLGCISKGRPMIALNHLDTIFAPVFMCLHEQGKLIYLRRNPLDLFESFYNKGQWNTWQLSALFHTFNPEFRWRRAGYDIPAQIAWYLHFTDAFAYACELVFPERYAVISSDDLFAQDERTIKRLLDFTQADIRLDQAVEHFSRKYNEKANRIELPEDKMTAPRNAFLEAYEKMRRE